MSTESQHHAAAAHETAIKSHKAAAELHAKGDHKLALEHAEKAVKESEAAHQQSKTAGH